MSELRATFGAYGGRYVPETVIGALDELAEAYSRHRDDAAFRTELEGLLGSYVGRPTPLYRALRLEEAWGTGPLYLKREDLCHTGAHKINNALGQVLLASRMGKRRIIAETGAGQHGVATATAAALMGLECCVFMGRVDMERQRLNVIRMRMLGAEVRPVDTGTRHPQARHQRGHPRLGDQRAHDPLRDRLGRRPGPVPGDRGRPAVGDRRRGPRAGARRGRAAAGDRGGLRGRRLERDRDLPGLPGRRGRRPGRRRGGRRGHRHRPARRLARAGRPGRAARLALVPAPGPRRPGRRGPLDLGRPRLPRRRPGAQPPARHRPGPLRQRRPIARRSRPSCAARARRASSRRSRAPTRWPSWAARARRWAPARSWSACRAGATRTSTRPARPWSSMSDGAARIEAAFRAAGRPLFIPYAMGGYPDPDTSAAHAALLARHADVIELGHAVLGPARRRAHHPGRRASAPCAPAPAPRPCSRSPPASAAGRRSC